MSNKGMRFEINGIVVTLEELKARFDLDETEIALLQSCSNHKASLKLLDCKTSQTYEIYCLGNTETTFE